MNTRPNVILLEYWKELPKKIELIGGVGSDPHITPPWVCPFVRHSYSQKLLAYFHALFLTFTWVALEYHPATVTIDN